METKNPHVRSVGHGPAVVLLHSSGSSGRQWDALTATLQTRYRLHAIDLHGHGSTAAWAGGRPMRLAKNMNPGVFVWIDNYLEIFSGKEKNASKKLFKSGLESLTERVYRPWRLLKVIPYIYFKLLVLFYKILGN